MKKTESSASENTQTIRENTPNQKLSWFTSKNTIIGSVIVGVIGGIIGLLCFKSKSKIAQDQHYANEQVDNKFAKDIIDYRKNAQLELLRERYALSAFYANQTSNLSEGIEEVVYSVHNPSDYLDEQYNLKPMVGFLIPEGFDALVYGMKNTMKSYFGMGTLIQIALGEKPKVLTQQEREGYNPPSNVYCIYVDGENGGTVFKQRYASLGSQLDGKMEIIEAETFGTGQKRLFDCIKNRCLLHPAGTSILLCADNSKSLMNDLSQNAGKAYLNELRRLRGELKEHGINLTTMTICHTEKTGEKIYGSYNTQCLAPIVIKLSEGDDYEHITLTLENSRTDLKGQARSLIVRNELYKFLECEELDSTEHPKEEDPKLAEARKIKAFLDAGHTKVQAAKEFGLSRPTINERLALLD